MADEQTPPMSDERLEYIRNGVQEGRGWGYVARSTIVELLAEVERLRAREAEYEKQRADYHHVASELAHCEREHDALLYENDALRSKLAGADQRAGRYSEELTMALESGKRIAEERDELRAALAQEQREHGNCEDYHFRMSQAQTQVMVALAEQNAAMRAIVEAVADAGVGDEYSGGSWLMFAGYDAETIRTKARALIAHPTKE